MSKKLLSFLLSELSTIRLICKNQGCGAVAEMSLQDLATLTHAGGKATDLCAFCGQPFSLKSRQAAPAPAPLWQLAQAVAQMRYIESLVDVEFVLPDDGKP